ncbi:GNAT family N-acetyltransferase [Streptococcus caprae]|uniref:GNAT family N-acetyltransferase n=1 Tax=Streptococcus caprae TaxID=1640501 RepID=A0ABV8CTZ9_9STRE
MAKMIGIRPVRLDEVGLLKEIAEQTFTETFGHDNSSAQLQAYFDTDYSIETLAAELNHPETEIDFIMVDNQVAGYIKLNWGTAQTEQELEKAIEVQRIYILKAFQGQGLGKFAFEYALEVAEDGDFDWAWLGVWEHNHKAQALYAKYGFEKFAEHDFPIGDKIDTDWLLRKDLR